MKFINLTPHPVVLQSGGMRMTFAKDPAVPVARLTLHTEEKFVDYELAPGVTVSIPVTTVTQGVVSNLPEPQAGVMYITSSMVASHVKRPDVIAPNTDKTCERDARGNVVAVTSFQTFTDTSNTKDLLTVASSLLAVR